MMMEPSRSFGVYTYNVEYANPFINSLISLGELILWQYFLLWLQLLSMLLYLNL